MVVVPVGTGTSTARICTSAETVGTGTHRSFINGICTGAVLVPVPVPVMPLH